MQKARWTGPGLPLRFPYKDRILLTVRAISGKTLAAVNGFVAAGLEWYLAGCAALRTSRIVQLTRHRPARLQFTVPAAFGAP